MSYSRRVDVDGLGCGTVWTIDVGAWTGRAFTDDRTRGVLTLYGDLCLCQRREPRGRPERQRRPIRSGDSVIAIGFPYHGLLTSDFTVTTGIVRSLSRIYNDTRNLQISAQCSPAPVAVRCAIPRPDRTLKFVRAIGNIPENINCAIKTGTIRGRFPGDAKHRPVPIG